MGCEIFFKTNTLDTKQLSLPAQSLTPTMQGLLLTIAQEGKKLGCVRDKLFGWFSEMLNMLRPAKIMHALYFMTYIGQLFTMTMI